MSRSLANKVALVTGASSGIGRAISEALAVEGAGLCLVGRRLGVLNSLAKRLRERAGPIQVFQADLTVSEDVHRLARSLRKQPGKLDLLIHAAGTISMARIEASDPDDFDAQYFCNARAPYHLTRAVLPLLRRSRGQVVFLNSTAGLSAPANLGAYAASKHALKAIADSLRQEVNAEGIRVLSVFLGRTATPMQKKVFRCERRSYRGALLIQPEDVARVLIPLVCLPPTTEVTDITLRPLIKSSILNAMANLWF